MKRSSSSIVIVYKEGLDLWRLRGAPSESPFCNCIIPLLCRCWSAAVQLLCSMFSSWSRPVTNQLSLLGAIRTSGCIMEAPSTTVEPLRYERAIPGAFQSPAAEDASGASRFFMYTIVFSHFHAEGTDAALQHLASDFLLLAPQMLDGEISGMSVNLHLPNCASVQAQVTYCGGPVFFDSEKVCSSTLSYCLLLFLDPN